VDETSSTRSLVLMDQLVLARTAPAWLAQQRLEYLCGLAVLVTQHTPSTTWVNPCTFLTSNSKLWFYLIRSLKYSNINFTFYCDVCLNYYIPAIIFFPAISTTSFQSCTALFNAKIRDSDDFYLTNPNRKETCNFVGKSFVCITLPHRFQSFVNSI